MNQKLLDALFRENFCRMAVTHRNQFVYKKDGTKCTFDVFVSQFRDDGSCLMSWRENGSFVKLLGYDSFEDTKNDIARILKSYKKFDISILHVDPETETDVSMAAYDSFLKSGYDMEGKIGMLENKKLFE